MKKTIILLNLRFSDFYSEELFKHIKKEYPIRLVAIIDQHFKDRIGQHILPYLDHIYHVEAPAKNGFLAEFDFNRLCQIVESEIALSKAIKIVCTDEFNLLHAGLLRRKYHLEGNTDLEMIPFRDKTQMKHVLQNAGIRVPKFKLLQLEDDFENLVKKVGLPFVVKPVDSCGSFGVYVVYHLSDYLQIKDELKKLTAQFEVEEYIEGKLYHVDSCIQNNELTFICANEYTYPNHDYTKGKVLGSIPLKSSCHIRNSLIDFSKRALKILGANNMINHMEIFITSNQELVFLEVSARPPGAMINLAHQINFSINLMDIDFCMQTGLTINIPKPKKDEHAFWMLFPLLPGKIKKFRTPTIKSRIEITYFRELGTTISSSECNSIVGKMAHAMIYHQDENVLRNDFEYMRIFSLAEMEPY